MKLTEQELQALARCVAVARAGQSILLGATAKERNAVRYAADDAMTKLRREPRISAPAATSEGAE